MSDWTNGPIRTSMDNRFMRYAIRKRFGAFCFTLCLILLNLRITFPPAYGQSGEITVVDIQYTLDGEIVEDSRLLDLLARKTAVRIGAPISRYYIRKSIEAIYAIGDFSQIEVAMISPYRDGRGRSLIFHLRSKIRVGKIEFVGTRLDKELLREAIRTRSGKGYAQSIAREDRQRILNLYRDYGYFETTVDLTASSGATQAREVDLLYKIEEGRRARIGEIRFEGGQSIPRKDLEKEIRSKVGETYRRQLIDEDLKRIQERYRQAGYLTVKVEYSLDYDDRSGTVSLRYTIVEGKKVEIRLIGDGVDPEELRGKLTLLKRDSYSDAVLDNTQQQIRRIYQQRGYYEPKVSYETEESDREVVIRFYIDLGEAPRIRQIYFEGFLFSIGQRFSGHLDLEIFSEDLRRAFADNQITLSDSVVVSVRQSKNWWAIADAANKQSYTIRREADGLEVYSEEGKTFKDAVLLDKMKTEPRSRFIIPGFRWLFSKGIYDPAAVETDRRALELFYKKEGYPDVRITVDKAIDGDNQLSLYVLIKEGKRQLIRRVFVKGNDALKINQSKLAAKPGKPYSKDTVVRRDVLYLRSLYNEKGYIYATIEDRYDPQTGTLTYWISERTQARFGKFHFYGNHGVKLDVLEREFENLGLYEGAVFNPDKLYVEARQRLFTLGLFREIEIKAPGQFEDKEKEIIDIDVRVDVRKPGSISASGGYSPSEGFRATVGITHNNLYKRNMRAGTKISAGTLGSLYEATLIEPWFKPPLLGRLVGHTIGTFRLFEDNLEERDDTRARGGTANFAKRFGSFSNFAVQYKYQELRQIRPDLSEIHTTVSSLGISFHRDNRDHFLNPQNGWLNEIAVEYAGGFIGGQTSFFKFTTDHRYYRQLGKGIVLASAIRLGFEEELRASRRLGIVSFERFWAGGSTTVRGYTERSLGPKDDSGNHRGDVLFIFNTELRFPVYKFMGGVVFFDMGNVWNQFSEIQDDPPRPAIGLGLRGNTPLGPARLDFGVPLRSGFKPQIYIELGHAF